MITCPVCGGVGGLRGVLGEVAHFTCRNCGLGFFIDAEIVLDLAGGDEEEEGEFGVDEDRRLTSDE